MPGGSLDPRTLSFPFGGGIRVGLTPSYAPPLGPPIHRFDDPRSDYRVRYFATSLRGALIEVFDQFRPDDPTEKHLLDVENLEGNDVLSEEPAGEIPDKWLVSQFLAIGSVAGDATFADVMDEDALAELNLRRAIRDVLLKYPETFGEHPRLDFGSIQGSGSAGRRLTQAVSRELYEAPEQFAGIRYISRHTENEQCWAVFDERVSIDFDQAQITRLDPMNPIHLDAVRSAAALLRLTLPPLWRNRS